MTYLVLLAFAAPFALTGAILLVCAATTDELPTMLKKTRDRARARASKRQKASRFRPKFKLSQDGKGGRSANS